MNSRVSLGLAVIGAAASPLQSQGTPPPDWRWAIDAPRSAAGPSQRPADTAVQFETMPPGYHVTTGPGLVLFHPAYRAQGLFAVEAEFFLFPSAGDQEYGLFVGGADLESDSRSYTAFVLRRDGSAAILRSGAGVVTPVAAWARHDSVKANPVQSPVKNVVHVAAEPKAIVFRVNGAEVARVPRDSVAADGHFGFRVGAGMNLHVTTLDFTQRLAPARP